MARLPLVTPLAEVTKRQHLTNLAGDPRISLSSIRTTGMDVEVDGPEHLVQVTFDPTSSRVENATVTLPAEPTTHAIQRVNRLLKGTGVEVLYYWRTKDTRVHVGRDYLALPSRIYVERAEPSRPTATGWRVIVDGAAALTPTAPKAAPVKATMAPAPAPAPAVPLRAPSPVPFVLPEDAPAPAPIPAPAPAPRRDAPTGLFRFPVVTPASQVITSSDVTENLDLLWKMHANGKRQVLALVGPTGTGKTSLSYSLAARHGVGIFTFDAAGAREFGDWVGTTHLRDGRTEFVPSGFLTAIDADGPFGGQPRIILIDEVNRAESSGALNALIPVLHGFGTLYVPEMGRGVNIDPSVMFILTANRGSQYAGTVGLDLALADRVTAWVRLNGLSPDEESVLIKNRTGLDHATTDLLLRAADRVRQAADRGELPEGGGISTRRLLLAAEKVANGFTPYHAAALSWLESYTDEGGTGSERAVVLSALQAVLR